MSLLASVLGFLGASKPEKKKPKKKKRGKLKYNTKDTAAKE